MLDKKKNINCVKVLTLDILFYILGFHNDSTGDTMTNRKAALLIAESIEEAVDKISEGLTDILDTLQQQDTEAQNRHDQFMERMEESLITLERAIEVVTQ